MVPWLLSGMLYKNTTAAEKTNLLIEIVEEGGRSGGGGRKELYTCARIVCGTAAVSCDNVREEEYRKNIKMASKLCTCMPSSLLLCVHYEIN